MHNPELIVMLTHNDFTVADAATVFQRCKESKARCWGMKEHPLPPHEMKHLYDEMKVCGKTTFLEVVGYSEEEGMEGAKLAVHCGCDVLMGTTFSASINAFCREHQVRYLPFVGEVTGRPSVLSGNVERMLAEAREYVAQGAFGIDLLGYRYEGDALGMISQFVAQIDAPVCLAGSIDSFDRLAEVKAVAPWTFTIGSAFFDNKFIVKDEQLQQGDLCETTTLCNLDDRYARFYNQINRVCDFMASPLG